MESLEAELDRAQDLDVGELADAIESIGFECTRCGACCTASEGHDPSDSRPRADSDDDDPHTATAFPDEVRELQAATGSDWRDVARPVPYGLSEGPDGPEGETFEWALQTDACGDCTFYEESGGEGRCTVHDDRPLICATYPFSVALDGTSQPMGEAVDEAGLVPGPASQGLGRGISRPPPPGLSRALKERGGRDTGGGHGVRRNYDPGDAGTGEVVVYDSEGPKAPDGTPR